MTLFQQLFLLIRPPIGISKYAAEMWPEPSSSDTPEVIEYRTNDIRSYNDPFDNPEKLDFKQSENEVESATKFGSKPLIIIKAKREIEPWGDWARNLPLEIEERNTAFLLASDDKILALSANSKMLVANTTHHNVHWHEPAIVINELMSLIRHINKNNT